MFLSVKHRVDADTVLVLLVSGVTVVTVDPAVPGVPGVPWGSRGRHEPWKKAKSKFKWDTENRRQRLNLPKNEIFAALV